MNLKFKYKNCRCFGLVLPSSGRGAESTRQSAIGGRSVAVTSASLPRRNGRIGQSGCCGGRSGGSSGRCRRQSAAALVSSWRAAAVQFTRQRRRRRCRCSLLASSGQQSTFKCGENLICHRSIQHSAKHPHFPLKLYLFTRQSLAVNNRPSKILNNSLNFGRISMIFFSFESYQNVLHFIF